MTPERDSPPELHRFDHREKMRAKIRKRFIGADGQRLHDKQIGYQLPKRLDRADRALAAARAEVDAELLG